jgi:hypothetical protein
LLVSVAGHALLVGVLFALPATPQADPAPALDTEVHEEVNLSLAPLPPEPRPSGPAEEQEPGEPPPFPVRLVDAPLPADAPGGVPLDPDPAPGVGGSGLASAGRAYGALTVPRGARSVVFLLDRSASMGLEGALAAARREVLANLDTLPPGTLFQVVPYNREAEPLLLLGRLCLAPVDSAARAEAARALADLRPAGSTDHAHALFRGLALRPDVLFLLTDAADLTPQEVAAVTRCNHGQTALHAVQLSRRRPHPGNSLARLAADNRGTFTHLPLEP